MDATARALQAKWENGGKPMKRKHGKKFYKNGEEKINELTSNVNKILNILKKKNENLKEKQSYVTKLEETIKDLNNEFKLLRHKSSNANRTEILYLKNQIERLQKENMTLKGEKIFISKLLKCHSSLQIRFLL